MGVTVFILGPCYSQTVNNDEPTQRIYSMKKLNVEHLHRVGFQFRAYGQIRDKVGAEHRFSVAARVLARGICQERAGRWNTRRVQSDPCHWFDVARDQTGGPCFDAMIEIDFKHMDDAHKFAEEVPALAKTHKITLV